MDSEPVASEELLADQFIVVLVLPIANCQRSQSGAIFLFWAGLFRVTVQQKFDGWSYPFWQLQALSNSSKQGASSKMGKNRTAI